MEEKKNTQVVALQESRDQFVALMAKANSLEIVNNTAAAFDAAVVVNQLEAVLTDEIITKVFIPLMNKKIGFKTDRDPARPTKSNPHPIPYSVDVVRTCIIDAAANGLLPTGNQFNIIAGTMYPTKEGYTALLTRLKTSEMRLKYLFEFDSETAAKSSDPQYIAIPCKISYSTAKDDLKGIFRYTALVKSNGETSSTDQLRGKAERKAKRAFYEFLTGADLGDADADTIETNAEVIETKTNDDKMGAMAQRILEAKKEGGAE